MVSASIERAGIQSLEIGVGVFKLLHELGRPVALHELASTVSMHRAKLHRYLVSLIRTGLVAQNADRRYRPGPYALRLMGDELRLIRLREAALSAMPRLARDVAETVFLSSWRNGRAHVLHFEEPLKPISIRPTVGTELSLLSTATGRAFAAYLPKTELEALLQRELKANVPRSQRMARRRTYLRELAEVRRRGIARSLAERYPSINSLSAPLFSLDRNVLLVITAFGLRETFDASWNGDLARTMRSWAAAHSTSKPEAEAAHAEYGAHIME